MFLLVMAKFLSGSKEQMAFGAILTRSTTPVERLTSPTSALTSLHYSLLEQHIF
jgi:hypothetical protein